MSKKTFFKIVCLLLTFTLSSCVKQVKDTLENSVEAIECANRLSEISLNESNDTCEEQIAAINGILNSCGEFLTQEEKDNLNFAKENCTDN